MLTEYQESLTWSATSIILYSLMLVIFSLYPKGAFTAHNPVFIRGSFFPSPFPVDQRTFPDCWSATVKDGLKIVKKRPENQISFRKKNCACCLSASNSQRQCSWWMHPWWSVMAGEWDLVCWGGLPKGSSWKPAARAVSVSLGRWVPGDTGFSDLFDHDVFPLWEKMETPTEKKKR